MLSGPSRLRTGPPILIRKIMPRGSRRARSTYLLSERGLYNKFMRVFPASVFLAVMTILLGAALAYAHSEGTSLEKQVGDYVVDIGYEPEELRTGERLLLDFNLLSTEGSPVDFTSVWVRLESEGETLLATWVANPESGP